MLMSLPMYSSGSEEQVNAQRVQLMKERITALEAKKTTVEL